MADGRKTLIHVIQGQFHVSRSPGDLLTTVLGSCVAACLHDPVLGIGGMNHFLLPGQDPDAGRNVKYGAHAMEQLINAMLRAGAHRNRLEANLFGGANVMKGLGRIGESNAAFARDYVRREGFRLKSADIGGGAGRRVRFSPAIGACSVERIDPAGLPDTAGNGLATRPPGSGSVELF